MVTTILSDDIINATELRNNQRKWLDRAYNSPVSIMSGAKKLVLLNRNNAKHMYSIGLYAEMIIQFCQEQNSGRESDSNVFPWIKYLSEQAIAEFHKELFLTFDEVMRSKDWLAFEEMLDSWAATAEAMTNPEMAELVTTDLDKEEFTRVE